jgi:hypothetical protein
MRERKREEKERERERERGADIIGRFQNPKSINNQWRRNDLIHS